MAAYVARRLLLMIPTLFGILLLNFIIIQLAPGGPVEQTLAQVWQVRIGLVQLFRFRWIDIEPNDVVTRRFKGS